MSEYEYDKNKPGGAANNADRDAPGVMTAERMPANPNGDAAAAGNWESDDWSMRSSSIDEDDPLIKLARLMEQNERNFEVAAQRSSAPAAEPAYQEPAVAQPVAATSLPTADEWSQEYTPAPQPSAPPPMEPQVQAPPIAQEPATAPLSRSLRESVQPVHAEQSYVPPAPALAPEPIMPSSDLDQSMAAPQPVSVGVPSEAAFEAPQRPSPITSLADDEQHDPFAPGGSSKPLPDRDFDVSRMPRAIRPAISPDHAQMGGLHGQAGSDVSGHELPEAETNFQTSAVRSPEPRAAQETVPNPAPAPVAEPAPQYAAAPDPISSELTRYADALNNEPEEAVLRPAVATAPLQSQPPMQAAAQPAAAAVGIQPASELSPEPMPKPDFSYLREVEDLRVPAPDRPGAVVEDVSPAPDVSQEEVYQVKDADILYEEYDDDNGGGLFASRGMMVAAGVVAFVVLGGAALLAYQAIFAGDDSGPPPLVLADKSPVRILPDGQAADIDGSLDNGSLSEPGDASDGQLVPRAEEPVTNLNPNIDQGRSVRVVDNQGVSPNSDPLGPRPVRTFVVRPDGSIVSNSATGTPTNNNSNGIQPRVVTTQPISGNGNIATTPPAGAPASGQIIPRPRPSAAGTQTASAQPAIGTSTVGGRAALPVAPRVTVGNGAPAFNPNAQPVQPSNRVPAGNTIPQTTAPATTQPATTQPAATAPASSGDFVVQVSSQRSEEAARSAFAGLQRRFPSVLGSQQPDIARADLGSRGVFYRVRVGPMETRQAASDVCQSLKNAGGDCIVARR